MNTCMYTYFSSAALSVSLSPVVGVVLLFAVAVAVANWAALASGRHVNMQIEFLSCLPPLPCAPLDPTKLAQHFSLRYSFSE